MEKGKFLLTYIIFRRNIDGFGIHVHSRVLLLDLVLLDHEKL